MTVAEQRKLHGYLKTFRSIMMVAAFVPLPFLAVPCRAGDVSLLSRIIRIFTITYHHTCLYYLRSDDVILLTNSNSVKKKGYS